MPNCKFCGKPVISSTVHHAACWEREADKIAEVFCNNYCKWSEQCGNEDELNEHCDICKFLNLLNLGL